MRTRETLFDTGVGLVSGAVGTKIMGPVQKKLYELESEEDRRREDAVRPGHPAKIAAEKTVGFFGLQLNGSQAKKAGMAFHYGIGASWGPVYMLLRRKMRMSPIPAALLTGVTMSIIVDEAVAPSLGFTAPNQAYPLSTHIRGFLAHAAFGLGIAATAEMLTHLLGIGYRGPRRRRRWVRMLR